MPKIIIKLALSTLLFLCLLNMPYGYYQFVRFTSMVVFVILGYYAAEEKKECEAIICFALAVLFQPLFKIALRRTIWTNVDVLVGVLIVRPGSSLLALCTCAAAETPDLIETHSGRLSLHKAKMVRSSP